METAARGDATAAARRRVLQRLDRVDVEGALLSCARAADKVLRSL
jgi:hypothetical protein